MNPINEHQLNKIGFSLYFFIEGFSEESKTTITQLINDKYSYISLIPIEIINNVLYQYFYEQHQPTNCIDNAIIHFIQNKEIMLFKTTDVAFIFGKIILCDIKNRSSFYINNIIFQLYPYPLYKNRVFDIFKVYINNNNIKIQIGLNDSDETDLIEEIYNTYSDFEIYELNKIKTTDYIHSFLQRFILDKIH